MREDTIQSERPFGRRAVANRTISIVLPTRNGARYISQSIQSIIEQTTDAWELLIIDDASTDSTLEIANSFAASDPRIRVISLETNVRLAGALNVGFGAASGRYLTWTSDDNVYRPQALEKMLAAIDASSADFVYSNYTRIDSLGNPIQVVEPSPPQSLIRHNCIGACFLYRAEVHAAVGEYRVDLDGAEDYDYWGRVYAAGYRMCPLREDLYLYRTHEDSMTSSMPVLVQKRSLAVREALVRTLDLERTQRAAEYLDMSNVARLAGQLTMAARFMLMALQQSPRHVVSHFAGRARREGSVSKWRP